MEAVGEHAPNQATRLGLFSNARFHQDPTAGLPEQPSLRAVPDPAESRRGLVPKQPAIRAVPTSDHAVSSRGVSDGAVSGAVATSLDLLGTARTTAAAELALSSFTDAADFAGQVEELSRTVEYLQVLAAAAVDRTRREAAVREAAGRLGAGVETSTGAGSTRGWVTGWGLETAHPGSACPAGPGSVVSVGDGCRNTAEFLRARLRISAAEARRRLALAAALLPSTGITGQPVPPAREELATALAAGTIPSRAATIITLALERAHHTAYPHTLARMEHALTRTAATEDQDFLTRITRRWADAIDQDGAEPGEEELRHRQGAFIRPTRRGLHHLEILATTDQFENLLTAMNTATNPRLHTPPETGTPEASGTTETAGSTAATETATAATEAGAAESVGAGTAEAAAVPLDRRTRPQQLLDGLIGACKAALTTASLPAAGGLRPQVMVTIDYRDLLTRLPNPSDTSTSTSAQTGTGPGPGTGTGTGTGTFAFTGPVTASTIRKIACDADIIPILLGSESRILDIGRTTRIFPPHIRKAITARDQGCTFPGCTTPAPWCEAHHTTYWSHNGPTSTENGTLLCTHHHHLIHKEL